MHGRIIVHRDAKVHTIPMMQDALLTRYLQSNAHAVAQIKSQAYMCRRSRGSARCRGCWHNFAQQGRVEVCERCSVADTGERGTGAPIR